MARMDNNRLPKQTIFSKLSEGTRNRGRCYVSNREEKRLSFQSSYGVSHNLHELQTCSSTTVFGPAFLSILLGYHNDDASLCFRVVVSSAHCLQVSSICAVSDVVRRRKL